MKIRLFNKRYKIVFLFLFLFLIIFGISTACFIFVHGDDSKLIIKLNGEKEITLEVGSEYLENGAVARYGDKNLSKNIKIDGKVDTKVVGSYTLVYNIKYKKLSKSIKRKVNVVDTTSPVITLNGNDIINITVGSNYEEAGCVAIDNYDKDLSDKIAITNNVDINKIGEYVVSYTVLDSSGNEASVIRKVNVIAKPTTVQKVAVLNYHFFYDKSAGEVCNDGNCLDIQEFKKQLNYLKENNYKTLTMKEFRDWMYGDIEIPNKSVLITIDDGALGTGTHNGNKLIPVLEEYQVHATLFLITGWWSIDNYRSPYLDIQSHTNNMHTEGFCTGVSRGAQMLCSSDNEVINDLNASISVTNSKLAFCFPFYAYNDRTIELVKQAGFELAFIGGGYKASRQTDKYHIPRYQIKQSTSLKTFINYVN